MIISKYAFLNAWKTTGRKNSTLTVVTYGENTGKGEGELSFLLHKFLYSFFFK